MTLAVDTLRHFLLCHQVASAVVGAAGEVQELGDPAATASDALVTLNTEPLAWLPPTLSALSLRLQVRWCRACGRSG